jgi:precorrin-6A/cobalt-precorrin-6A reductase
LIGGTQESAVIARELADRQVPCWVTVTTPTAVALYPAADCLRLWVGHLTSATMENHLAQQQIVAIVDASHPFATEISRLAIATARRHHLPYLRYERPSLAPAPGSILVQNYADLFRQSLLLHQRVLLTIGYRSLPLFQPWQQRATLFARILPSPVALDTALAAGFAAERLIALRPPLSLALEKALWQQWQISVVVAKASGHAGGEVTKQQLATTLGVQLVLLQRPQVAYPQVTDQLPQVLQFCRSVQDGR